MGGLLWSELCSCATTLGSLDDLLVILLFSDSLFAPNFLDSLNCVLFMILLICLILQFLKSIVPHNSLPLELLIEWELNQFDAICLYDEVFKDSVLRVHPFPKPQKNEINLFKIRLIST